MMRQDGTAARKAAIRDVPEWRLNKRTYEVAYLMKLGNLTRHEAMALFTKHDGDSYEITAELFSLRGRSPRQISEV
jgi:hypothetical protein